MAVMFSVGKADDPRSMELLETVCRHCGAGLTKEQDSFCCSGCAFWYQFSQTKNLEFPEAFPVYDVQGLREQYNLNRGTDQSRYRFHVAGLQCSSCVHSLEDLPLHFPEILHARVHYAVSELYIETTSEHSLDRILEILKSMGYPAVPLRANENSQDQSQKEDRDLLSRLAVAGACAGNIMLLSVANYAGLGGPWARGFHLLSIVLFWPIAFYSMQPLYRSAWSAVKTKSLNMDVPLVIAFLTGSGLSILNWWRGQGGIYLDSTAGFIFFILVSRWFLRVSNRKLGEGFSQSLEWQEKIVVVERDKEVHRLPARELKKNDILFLSPDDIVVVDCLLQSSHAQFDTSWWTGEILPQSFSSGAKIPAGYRLKTESAQLKVTSEYTQSELMQGLRSIESDGFLTKKSPSRFDQAAKYLLLIVFSLAAVMGCFGFLLGLSFQESMERALGLLVVACPCALAFGAPLAYGLSMRKILQAGALVKNSAILDRLQECNEIAFDKTGTLTQGKLELVSHSPAKLPEWVKSLILAMEKNSRHPVASAFRDLWARENLPSVTVQDVIEVAGEKVYGLYSGQMFSLKRGLPRNQPSGLLVGLFQGEVELAQFEFKDQVRSEAEKIVSQLSQKYPLSILSGDEQKRVEEMAQQISVPWKEKRGGCTPIDKALWLEKHPNSLFLGDGINDLQALAKAHVGIAMDGPLLSTLQVADVYFLKPGLQPLKGLIDGAKLCRKLVRQNLMLALIYNVLAGSAALMGFINPLAAAVLMPLSSLLILANSWRAAR